MKILIMFFLVCVLNYADTLKEFDKSENFIFYREDNRNYESYKEEFQKAYDEIHERFKLGDNRKIKVYIFENQKNFIKKVFGYYEPKVTSVGMAKEGEETIYITSYYDTATGRDKNEYMKVAKHELVHKLLPNEKTWLSEGVALYLANQPREMIQLPKDIKEVEEYIDYSIYNKEAYGYYSLFSRYIIEKSGINRYMQFYFENDWNIIGYRSKQEFCKEIYDYISKNF